jgi:taurine dioxygenase
MAQLQIKRIGYALGTEVTGVDLGSALDDETIAAIRRAWLDHPVLSFPKQDLSAEQLMAFTSRFGELDDNETSRIRDPENPYVLINSNRPIDGKPWNGLKVGRHWHSDGSLTERPEIGTFLLCKEIPEVGGDTMYANTYMAYESLSPAMQRMIEPLSAVHDISTVNTRRDPAHHLQSRPPGVHPVVKIHSETKRKALYVGERATKFVGMKEEESKPLLQFLTRHAVTYEFTYRHRWQANELVMWDNRCTMHFALSDYDLRRDPRHMIRCAVMDPMPVAERSLAPVSS